MRANIEDITLIIINNLHFFIRKFKVD